jgi:hypothetical protein
VASATGSRTIIVAGRVGVDAFGWLDEAFDELRTTRSASRGH